MKVLGFICALFIGWDCLAESYRAGPPPAEPHPAEPPLAEPQLKGFELKYVNNLNIQIFSSSKGVVQEEHLICTPQTCCFSERFYCFMEKGQCVCPLYVCERWPDKNSEKDYWMLISGTDAEKVCRPGFLHDVTDLCLCDSNKDFPCDECDRPAQGPWLPPQQAPSLSPEQALAAPSLGCMAR